MDALLLLCLAVFPFVTQAAYPIEELAEHAVHGRVDLRGVGVHVVARVVRIYEGGQGVLLQEPTKIPAFCIGHALRYVSTA